MGWSAGLTFLYEGGVGMPGGSRGAAAARAAWMSWAAASMLRSSVNTTVIWVGPGALANVIESMPAMVENCRSSGVATAEAMVSGLAPGWLAATWGTVEATLGGAGAPALGRGCGRPPRAASPPPGPGESPLGPGRSPRAAGTP